MNDREFKDTVRKVWDLSSSTYDNIPGHRIGSPEEEHAWKEELGRDLPGSRRVLDIGCGTCAMGLLLSGMGHRVTGVDLSRDMMVKARKNAEVKGLALELAEGDAEHLPFRDMSFDVIVSRHLLWTLPHPVPALREWFRVLAPGGKLLVIDGVWNDNCLRERVKMKISSGLTRLMEPENTHPGSYGNEIRSLLPHYGGTPEESMHVHLKNAGFPAMQFRDLMYIRDLQKSRLSWYRRIAQGRSYYIVCSEKN